MEVLREAATNEELSFSLLSLSFPQTRSWRRGEAEPRRNRKLTLFITVYLNLLCNHLMFTGKPLKKAANDSKQAFLGS